nr:guanine nucleotide-binding protein G(f) subunit alpha-like [Cherax quadricarinatus]
MSDALSCDPEKFSSRDSKTSPTTRLVGETYRQQMGDFVPGRFAYTVGFFSTEGAGESGKTTIIKQMKILHISGFSPEEKREKAQDIRNNIMEGITTLTRNLDELNIELEQEENQEAKDYILSIDPENFNFPEVGDSAEGVHYVIHNNKQLESKYTHDRSLSSYNPLHRSINKVTILSTVTAPKSEPSKFMYKQVLTPSLHRHLLLCIIDLIMLIKMTTYNDILHSRRRTTDIQKIEFEVKVPKKYGGGSLNFWMYDVGGQRGERKKWIQVFDGIQAVLFLVSTSCFDLVIREDEETNRLQESINIFRSMWNSRFLKYSGFIVFLNKQDILKEKVTHGRTRIAEYFPEYNNYKLLSKDRDSQENEEYLRARCFIRDKFIDISKQVVKREGRRGPGIHPQDDWPARECYCHFTRTTKKT